MYAYILLNGLDACPVSCRQLRSLNHIVVSCVRKLCNVNTSEIAAECIKNVESMTLLTDAVAMRKDNFIRRYWLNSSVVCEICSLIVK